MVMMRRRRDAVPFPHLLHHVCQSSIGDSCAIIGAGAPAQLINNHQGLLCGLLHHFRCLLYGDRVSFSWVDGQQLVNGLRVINNKLLLTVSSIMKVLLCLKMLSAAPILVYTASSNPSVAD